MSNETEQELQRAVGRIEGQLGSLDERFGDFIDEVRSMHARDVSVSAALSKRIGKLEKWQTRLIASGTVLVAAVGILFKYFTLQTK
jgi:hypothetical protein